MGQQKSAHSKPDISKITIDKQKKGLSFGLSAMKGWRKFMQDTYISILNFNQDPDMGLFAIFDGHAGIKSNYLCLGCEIAILVRDQFPKQLSKNEYFINGNYAQALQQTFIKMDQIIKSDYGVRKLEQIIEQECNRNNARNLFGQSNAGCTAIVCLVTARRIYVANAGDSKGIAFAKNECISLNIEHKPELQKEQLRIKQAGGIVQNGRIMGQINISRCIGDLSFKNNLNLERNNQMIICDPEIVEIDRYTCQYILLGSDGIWESKNNLAMHHWIKGLSVDLKISQKLSLLFDEEISKIEDTEYGKDNMTAILVEFV